LPIRKSPSMDANLKPTFIPPLVVLFSQYH
jgi:hypothetical protein